LVSLWVLGRRLLGRRGTFLLRSIASELAFRVGLYERADETGREDGISAMVCTLNEEDWVVPSLVSVEDLVDEYVVVDSSTDRTPELVERLKEERGLNARLFKIPPGSLTAAKNLAIKEARHKWILHWDADFVAFESMPKRVKEIVESLDARRHYLVYWKYLTFCGDLAHLCSNPYHVEHWLFTYSSKIRCEDLDFGRGIVMDALVAPLRLYKAVYVDEVLGVHLAYVRRPERLAAKLLLGQRRKELKEAVARGASFDEALRASARKAYETEDLREAGLRIIAEMTSKLPKYEGPLPKILLDYASKSSWARSLLP